MSGMLTLHTRREVDNLGKDGKELPLLGESHKTILGDGIGVKTAILYLSPADESGFNLCPAATVGCRIACLGHSSGHMTHTSSQRARIRKSLMLMLDRAHFMRQLRVDVAKLVKAAAKANVQAAVRLNGTSDVGWESIAPELFAEFPQVHFYDYTKRFARVRRSLTDSRWPENYRLTFSRSGENDAECAAVLALGGNVAAVFATKSEFPTEFMGAPIVSGEAHDYRYGDPKGHIVALKARGDAIYDTSGFVVRVEGGKAAKATKIEREFQTWKRQGERAAKLAAYEGSAYRA